MASLVEELQRDALNWRISVIELLQKCRVVAAKLSLEQLDHWARQELDGYDDDNLPKYRKVVGLPVAWHPYTGDRPIGFADSKTEAMVSSILFTHPISEIEHLLHQCEMAPGGCVSVGYPAERAILLRKWIGQAIEPKAQVGASQLKSLVEAVRGQVLGWALQLDAAGIRGDGMSFSNDERNKAQRITYSIRTNIHGDVGNAQIGTMNSSQGNFTASLDIDALKKIVGDLKRHAKEFSISPAAFDELAAEVQTLDAQSSSPKPRASVIRECLTSVRTILEQTGGSLLAAGIIYSIDKFLGY